MSESIKKVNNNNITYNPNKWVISSNKDVRVADMRKSFRELGVLQPAKSNICDNY